MGNITTWLKRIVIYFDNAFTVVYIFLYYPHCQQNRIRLYLNLQSNFRTAGYIYCHYYGQMIVEYLLYWYQHVLQIEDNCRIERYCNDYILRVYMNKYCNIFSKWESDSPVICTLKLQSHVTCLYIILFNYISCTVL